ncbi:3-mercaptopyruvate sulfurtransferase-like [Denticeps clupeoides]|uniref:Sulfurtransferase n=1 Tax=Denticeps clupeoides TaxID=299321 RepID=A0AAY3ZY90_9TELE|nr:3-mercaptopyruvate sulfurtransferase-like [Denticeps clupeoides]XP_028829108.1 3-mercaptopyruvate sulfurtransferase-like [Denticeps clupeoides]
MALVAARWLADAVRSGRVGGNIRVLDASWYLPKLLRDGRSDFAKRHVPGAHFFDLDRCSDRRTPLDHMLPPEGRFRESVGRLGVGNDTHVVVYDASEFGAFSAPRVWWMFRVFGHASVSVLDGGLRRWLDEGRPVTAAHRGPEPAEFSGRLDRSRVKTYEDVLRNVDSREFQVVDARPAGRFRGLEPEPRDNTEPGHIPGSINMPFTSFLDPSGTFLPAERLTELFERAGVDLGRPLCATCGSGVTACHVVLAAHLCGHPGVSVYDGAWSEWYTKATPENVISEGLGKHR